MLILGAGKMAESSARSLQAQGAAAILVANRTHSRAQELARELGGRALRYDQLAEGLLQADIVISSTSAPHFVLLQEHVTEAMRGRDGRPLFLIDIAVPRDIDPQVAHIPGVHLYDIDDLGAGVEAAAAGRAAEVEAAARVADEVAEEFWSWLAVREAGPMLAALRDHFEQARQEQLRRVAPKMGRLSAADRKWVEQLTHSLVKRLLHGPTVKLKEELMRGNDSAASALTRIYGIEARPDAIKRRPR
jgi:glutamyl-tRNA reductase